MMKTLFISLLVGLGIFNLTAQEAPMYFGASLGDKISLFDNRLNLNSNYGFGMEGSTLYFKSVNYHRWYVNKNADGGLGDVMELNSSTLTVNGRIVIGASDPYLKINNNSKHLVLSGGSGWTDTGAVILLTGAEKSSAPSTISFYSGNGLAMHVNSSRNVGIGTSTPTHKLEVNGTIRTKEVIVETANWPDYVFGDSYELPSLSEVRAHIAKNGHLPGMPSAKSVFENGIGVGEIQRLLTEKVEELTLYAIEKDKQIAELNERLARIEAMLVLE